MWRIILTYAAVLALGVFLLEWLRYRFSARELGIETLSGLIGPGGAGMGAMPVMIAILLVVSYLGSLGFFPIVRMHHMARADTREVAE